MGKDRRYDIRFPSKAHFVPRTKGVFSIIASLL